MPLSEIKLSIHRRSIKILHNPIIRIIEEIVEEGWIIVRKWPILSSIINLIAIFYALR